MPLQPNCIERFLINRGIIPGILSDMGLPMFQFFAMIRGMEPGFFRYLNEEAADLETLAQKAEAAEFFIDSHSKKVKISRLNNKALEVYEL